jgi:ubiquinol-cytochrome c reductase iron-sulfur subunit
MVDLAQEHIRHAHAGDTNAAFMTAGLVPCHRSICDASQRIRRGVAPRNLAGPPYAFAGNTTVKIG